MFDVETIRGRKVFKGGNYMGKYDSSELLAISKTWKFIHILRHIYVARQQSKVKSSIEPVFIDLDTLKIFSSGIPPHMKKKVSVAISSN